MTINPLETKNWSTLETLAESFEFSVRDLFKHEPTRAEDFTLTAGDLRLDFSKNLVNPEIYEELLGVALETGVAQKIDDMFAGKPINTTEGRAVGHVALRMKETDTFMVDGVNVVPEVHLVQQAMKACASAIRDGEWVGHTGKRITHVINLGIGGSDLGPAMVYRALAPYRSGPEVRFVSNVDGADLARNVADLNPETTLFIVASKSFTTVETLTNATSAREWLLRGLGADNSAVAKHFVALSTNGQGVADFGIDTNNMFGFWDWVGGRYSVDSAIGFSVMIAIGEDNWDEFLDGFYKIDQVLRTVEPAKNPIYMHALIGLWYRNFLDLPQVAVLPYSHDMARFPAYLQQLDMESNGKSVRADGTYVDYQTGPIVFGEPGTNGQHAFYQLIHQGTDVIPCEFIGFMEPTDSLEGEAGRKHNDQLFANMIAQAQAMAWGQREQEVREAGVAPDLISARTFPGSIPTTVITAPSLTPSVLGQLIALYEHKVLIQGAIWGINSFDQWGVQLGKVLATAIEPQLSSTDPIVGVDPSTQALIEAYRAYHASKD